MSAILINERPAGFLGVGKWVHIPDQIIETVAGNETRFASRAEIIDGIAFFLRDFDSLDWIDNARRNGFNADSFAFDGRIPDTFIQRLIGEHPEALVGGFTASAKPSGCEWMSESRIKSIVNYMGSVLVELEPAT